MDVLRTFLQLGKGRDGVAHLFVGRVIDLEQDRLVALDDKRSGGVKGHEASPFTAWRFCA